MKDLENLFDLVEEINVNKINKDPISVKIDLKWII